MVIRAVHDDRPESCTDGDLAASSSSVPPEYSTELGDAGSSVSEPTNRSEDGASPPLRRRNLIGEVGRVLSGRGVATRDKA